MKTKDFEIKLTEYPCYDPVEQTKIQVTADTDHEVIKAIFETRIINAAVDLTIEECDQMISALRKARNIVKKEIDG